MDNPKNILRNYAGILLLLTGITIGSIAGFFLGDKVTVLKPLGDIFLNLLFTAVIPLVFFAVSSAISGLDRSTKIGKLMTVMFSVFLLTVLISAIITIVGTWLFPINQHSSIVKQAIENHEVKTVGEELTQLLTVGEFSDLLSRKSMLALIIFSVLVGFASLHSGESGESFRKFLTSGTEVMKKLVVIIMKLAPIGLGAYFAYQVGVLGPQLFGTYARALGLYYGLGLFYFIVFFSLYAFVAGGYSAVKRYWKNNIIPSLTSVGTCSSIASIPANLDASVKMGIPSYIANVTMPLGGTLHKDGSSISSVIKIAVVFAIFGKDLAHVDTVLLALGITVLVSVVEGGIPNGGYIGELLMISAYHLPPEALPPAMIIGTLVDPMATLLNVTGDTAAGMLITRIMEGKNWLSKTVTS
ncbi:cation:dicarboxylase symporter family transporter [Pedobacter sp. HMF7647]|uniref:Cation:dicarboxylase symporter family transporter n=1 Tax=Hufsiella arboris TaxID=2695275 RepID=A0A7K1Y6W0_9SPHI|nr:dicarboxylate/amino acid:cation symporter [Hufsiella arboris]MXV49788.1 cation:dicarboxylase symporter family transporter [Hufsiella arboris]